MSAVKTMRAVAALFAFGLSTNALAADAAPPPAPSAATSASSSAPATASSAKPAQTNASAPSGDQKSATPTPPSGTVSPDEFKPREDISTDEPRALPVDI